MLFVYNAIDDFVMTNLKSFAGRPIKTAEAEDIDLGDDAGKDADDASAAAGEGLSTEDADDLCTWLKESALADRVRIAATESYALRCGVRDQTLDEEIRAPKEA